MPTHQKNILNVVKELTTNLETGLSTDQYHLNLKKFGKNTFEATKINSIFHIFFSQFNDPLTHMLFAAAAVIFFSGEYLDAAIILGILTFNACIGTFQEKRMEKILEHLHTFFQGSTLVIRNGKEIKLSNQDIVPGDIIYLRSGEKIPADAIIFNAVNCTVDESTVTGESLPIEKNDENNFIAAGTFVATGTTKALVIATGSQTMIGKIYQSTETIDTNTPLKEELETISSWIFKGVFIMCATLFLIGFITQQPFIQTLVMITALFICVIPEGLPVVLTIIFMSGAYKLAQKKVAVKRLKSLEALGKLDVIITDKTGTLTYGDMVVTSLFIDNRVLQVSGISYHVKGEVQEANNHQPTLQKIATACTLLNDTHLTFDTKTQLFNLQGSPTQAAAFILAQKINGQISNLAKNNTVYFTIPFDTHYKYGAVFYRNEKNEDIINIMGAPEIILNLCSNVQKETFDQLQHYTQQGYRVVCIAEKTFNPDNKKTLADYQSVIDHNFTILGLLAIQDEPRANIEKTIKIFKDHGIQIIIATGDHTETAQYIAKKIGILEQDRHTLTSQEFDLLTDEQVFNKIGNYNTICSRFLPQHKLRLVKILHHYKKIVATTGDGINDAPALMASDVGIAMGNRGSQLTQHAADIILLDDNFENIVYAMQEGSSIFYTLKRTLLYFFVSNASEVFVIFLALLTNIAAPLLPSQILLLNLMTDGFLDAALATEKTHLKALPQEKSRKIFTPDVLYTTLWFAIPASLLSFFVFLTHYTTDIAYARTLTFVTLTCFQWFNALNCRSEKESVFTIGFFSNFWFIMATFAIIALQSILLYSQTMHYIFKTTPLSVYDILYAIFIASTIFIAEELRKYLQR